MGPGVVVRLVKSVLACVFLANALTTGIVAAAAPVGATPPGSISAAIPPGPVAQGTTPSVPGRSDLAVDSVPTAPSLTGLSALGLTVAMARPDLAKPRTVRHASPKKGDDPSDPATVRIDTGAWLLFFLDSAGNLYQQLNPGTALNPYWQSGNVIVSGPVDHPDVVRLDSSGTSTLGLFYLRSVGGLNQVFERTSAIDGATWANEVQITSSANWAARRHHRQGIHNGRRISGVDDLNLRQIHLAETQLGASYGGSQFLGLHPEQGGGVGVGGHGIDRGDQRVEHLHVFEVAARGAMAQQDARGVDDG